MLGTRLLFGRKKTHGPRVEDHGTKQSGTLSSMIPTVNMAINEISSDINAKNVVVFCGAGISRDSGFPVVNEFIPYVLLTLCADSREISDFQDTLKNITDATNQYARLIKFLAKKMLTTPEVIEKIINTLPFEAFVELLFDYSVVDKILGIYDAESYEPRVVPNANHAFIAGLAAEGKVNTIVTTNFDQLIETALEQQGKFADRDYDIIYREEDFGHIDWAQDRIRLIKIHGSVNDKKAMAITLRQVARKELSEARREIIRHVFSKGSHKQVLILGYSCSDVFDLSPQIEALTGNLKKICYVQHAGRQTIDDIRKKEDKNPFKKYTNSTRLFFNTGLLVELLWKSTLQISYPTVCSDAKEHPPLADWKTKVCSWHAETVMTYSQAINNITPMLQKPEGFRAKATRVPP